MMRTIGGPVSTLKSLSHLQAFVRVAELASFTQAAQVLGVPKTSISAAVQRLEAQLGTRLLHRTTRRVQMTQDGQAFCERCRDLLADFEELQTMFHPAHAALHGRLRVDMSIGLARNVVIPRLPEFLRAHPQLEIELSSTDRRVDLVREGFDCVLRVGVLGDSSLVARLLGHYGLLNCVSPAYVAAYGLPRSLADLARHRLVHYQPVLGPKSPGFEYVDDAGATRFAPMAGALTVNNSEAYLQACFAGLGIIQVPEPAMRPLIARGRLIEVLPQHRAAPMPVSIVYANRRQLPKRVQVFMQWIEGLLKPQLQS
jgi:DNA-binding transcriptional LysR family regulator